MKVAVAGFGQEGRTSYEYWTAKGDDVTIADERSEVTGLPENAAVILGKDAFSGLGEFDLIIRSPSVNPGKLPYGNKVWSATNEFFKQCPAPIIGVTGTKGKGTTSSLITSILRADGRTVHLVGNIGVPALNELSGINETDVVVFELSSFQLWDLQKSPHVAVVLGIEADHLDVHDDMEDYVNAKAQIVAHQTPDDLTVYNRQNDISATIASRSEARTVPYPDTQVADTFASSLVIPGRHNVENAAAAIAAVTEYVTDESVIRNGLQSFTGLPHRIKFIREHSGVRYYDDSYSSAPSASIAAMKSFTAPKRVILGGYEKHADFSALADFVANDDSVAAVYLIGQTKTRLAEALSASGVDAASVVLLEETTLPPIVQRIASEARSGDVVLLSPGCASFDMFKNFTDRGEQFVRIVEAL